MSDERIEEIIRNEFGDVLDITDESISKLSFAESCIYLDTLNKINDRINELKAKTLEEGE